MTGTATQPKKTDIKSLSKIPLPLTAVSKFEAHLQPQGMPAMQYAQIKFFSSIPARIASRIPNAIPKITTSKKACLIER